MRRGFVGALATIVILAATVTATESATAAPSSGKGTTTTRPTAIAPSSAPSADRGVTATSIKVGGLGDATLFRGADVGAKARFQRANDTGGINGRTIDYTGFTDDGGVPATASQAATKIVQDNGIFAVVPAITGDFTESKVLARRQMPYFGWGLSSSFCGNDYGFGFTGCLVPKGVASNAWGLLVAKVFGTTSNTRAAAIVTENTPVGQYELTSIAAGVRSAKLKVAYEQSSLGVPATADMNTLAKTILVSNRGKSPDAVFVVGTPSNVFGLQQALAGNGFLGVFTNRIEYAPNLVAPSIGSMVLTQTAPTESASQNPAMAQLITDVQKVAPGQPIDQAVIAGYWSADLFVAAVQKAGKNLTTQSLVRAANRNFTYAVANTVGPTKFPAAHLLPSPCGALVASDGTAYKVKVPYTCGRIVPAK
jgi:ABC-type branched-subunit amino acid transport system substrate-binding protein